MPCDLVVLVPRALLVPDSTSEISGGMAHLGNHVIDEPMLVPDAHLLKFALVLLLIDLLEDLQELAIVLLQNGVLG